VNDGGTTIVANVVNVSPGATIYSVLVLIISVIIIAAMLDGTTDDSGIGVKIVGTYVNVIIVGNVDVAVYDGVVQILVGTAIECDDGTTDITELGTLDGTFVHYTTTNVGLDYIATTYDVDNDDTNVHGTTTGLENVDGMVTVPGNVAVIVFNGATDTGETLGETHEDTATVTDNELGITEITVDGTDDGTLVHSTTTNDGDDDTTMIYELGNVLTKLYGTTTGLE